MSRLTFAQKQWIPLVLSLVCIVAVAAFGAFQNKSIRLAERERGLSDIVDTATTIASRYAALVATGRLSADDGRREALATLRAVRFGKTGYIAVIDREMRVVLNPVKPDTEGQSFNDFQDRKGEFVYREMVSIAKDKGEGFVDYYAPRPGSTEQIRKRSYVKLYPAWGWIFVTGAYVDDIDAAFWRTASYASAFVLAMSIALSTVVLLINRSLLHTLGGSPEYAKEIVRATASGDLSLTIDVSADGESLTAQLRLMQARLRSAIAEIRQSAETITFSMEEVAAGNMDLSRRAEEQAAALQESTATLVEFKNVVALNTENAKAASRRAADALSLASQGNDAVVAVAVKMGNIAASSAEVNGIVGMIQSVSFQTNILALNAAVEAARAKEHGRGFAVVASEVRSLAQRSSSASRDIEALIATSGGHVQEGAQLMTVAGRCVNDILDTIRQVDVVLNEIASTSEEQSVGVESISYALSQIDDVTQHNAGLAEQSAAATEAVRDQARTLLASVSAFRLR